MINPTWQDMYRKIIYVPTEYLVLDKSHLSEYACEGSLVSWNALYIKIELDGKHGTTTCKKKNLFWKDGKEDFNELKSIGG